MSNNYKKFVSWLKVKKIPVILFVIIIIGAYLRLSDFSDLARFNADQVRDAGIIDAMRNGEGFPLLGPKAGGTTFKLGPAFYYLEYFSSFVFGNNPAGIAVIVPIFSVASIYLFFLLFKFFFTPQTSLLLTFLYAISFYAVRYARFAWNPNIIPFFLLAFLLLLIKIANPKNKKIVFYYLALGTILGIGMQLHTTMLLLMPTVFLLTCANIFRCKKKLIGWHIFATIAIAALLYSPAFLYDLRNSGKNLTSFFEGTSTKTEEVSLLKNVALDAQYFFQGSAYVLSGIEPQKNWTRISKLLTSKNPIEISVAIFGTIFFCFGGFLVIRRMRNLGNEDEKNFIFPVASLTVVSFLLFFLIANELNLRFFISLIFLPFLFFGVIIEFLNEKIKNKNVLIGIIASVVIILSFSNIYTYRQTYNLSNYTARESAYGGISLGESKKIHNFIASEVEKNSSFATDFYLEKFEFQRSIEYFNKKAGLKIKQLDDEKTSSAAVIFAVYKNIDLQKKQEEILIRYNLLNKQQIGRFTIFSLTPKKEIKIGFITDIHAKLSKKFSYELNPETTNALDFFISQMNVKFQPEIIFQDGDLIDGTDRRGEKSIGDMNFLIEKFKTLKAPLFHVLGNHDLRGLSKQEWIELTKSKATNYFIDYSDLRAVIIDGNDLENDPDNYGVSSAQFRWLEEVLSARTAARKIVLIHYPIMSKNIQPGDKMIIATQAERLREIFRTNNVLAVFSGHIEKLELNEDAGVQHFVIPGLDRSQNKSVAWLDSYAEITVGENVDVDFYYKKDRSEKAYRTIKIPSEEFDLIEK